MRIVRRVLLLLVASLLVVAPAQIALAANTQVTVGVGDTTVLIQGHTSPLALVTIMDGSTVIGTTSANSSGVYSKLFTNQTPGLHTYQLYAEDTQGRVTDTVAQSVSVQANQQTTVTAFLPPTIALSDNEVVQGESITISGSSVPSAEIILYIDQSYVTVPVNSAGLWSYVLPTAQLSVGEHQIYAVAIRGGGEQSHPTQLRTIIVKASAEEVPPEVPPEAPAPQQPTEGRPRSPRITSPKPGARIEEGWVWVCGTAEPGTQVELWNRGQLVGSTFADSKGNWCIRLYLRDFSNELMVRACRGTLCSSFSSGVRIFRVSPMRPDGLALILNRYRLVAYVGDPISLTARISGGESPYRLVMTWGDGQQTSLHPAHSPQLTTHRYDNPGKYNGTAIARDKNGETVEVSFSVQVLPRPGVVSSWVSILLVPAVVVATGVAGTAVFLPRGWRFFGRKLIRVWRRYR